MTIGWLVSKEFILQEYAGDEMKCNSMKFHQATTVSMKLKITCYVSRGIGEQPPITTEEKAKQGSDTWGEITWRYVLGNHQYFVPNE